MGSESSSFEAVPRAEGRAENQERTFESKETQKEVDALLLKKEAREMLFGALWEELGNSKVVELAVEAHGGKELVDFNSLKDLDATGLESARNKILGAELQMQEDGGYDYASQFHALSPSERATLFDQFTLQIEAERAYKHLSEVRRSFGKESGEYAHAHGRWKNLKAARKIEEDAFSPRLRALYLEAKFGNIIPARKAYEHIGRFVVIDRIFGDVEAAREREREQEARGAVFSEASFAERLGVLAEVDPETAKEETASAVFNLEKAIQGGAAEEVTAVCGQISDAARILEQEVVVATGSGMREEIRDGMLTEAGKTLFAAEHVPPRAADARFTEQIIQAIDRDEVTRQGELEESMKRALTEMEEKAPSIPKEVEKILEQKIAAVAEALPQKEVSTGVMSRMRRFAKRHLMALSALGALSFMGAKKMGTDILELAQYPKLAIELIEQIPQAPRIPVFGKTIALEASRYRTGPTLRAFTVGVDDYMEHLTRNAVETAGFQGVAAKLFERDLSQYMENYEETWRKNRYTSITENTMDLYMHAFVETYLDAKQGTTAPDQFYGQFTSFLRENVGIKKAHELDQMILEQHGFDISNPFTAKVFEESAATEKLLEMAKGKSNIFFNEEDGTMQVLYGGTLVDTYSARAGFLDTPDDPDGQLGKLGYSRLPDGVHRVGEIKKNYTTLRWREAAIPYGAALRYAENGEVEYERDGEWLHATGPDAVFFDRGRKVEPRKTDKGRAYWDARSQREAVLEKMDFESKPGALLGMWDKNPFGEVAVLVAGRGEAIHANPVANKTLLTPSHGCFRVTTENMRKLIHWISPGAKMEITSEKGKNWRDSVLTRAPLQVKVQKVSKNKRLHS